MAEKAVSKIVTFKSSNGGGAIHFNPADVGSVEEVDKKNTFVTLTNGHGLRIGAAVADVLAVLGLEAPEAE